MTIHVVKKGETVNSIADFYGVSRDRLILENGIVSPYRLAEGEALVILYPKIIHTVQEGDTLSSIADLYGVTIDQILRNNTYLSNRENIFPGETIVISYEDKKNSSISTNGFVYHFVDKTVLRQTLPFLTYLTVYGNTFTGEGEINNVDDTEIIKIAKENGVAPIMMLTALSSNMEEEIEVMHSILSNKEIQNQFFNNILEILQSKGYSGVNINTPYILPTDRNLYEEFIIHFTEHISSMGYKAFNTFSIRIFQFLTGMIFTGIEYSKLGNETDGITLITFEYGYSEGIPPGTLSMDTFRRFLSSTTKLIPSEKIYIGISILGYIWKYPYIPGVTKGRAVSYESVINSAIVNNAAIQFDETTNTAYLQYSFDEEYIIRFWDARSINNIVQFIPEFGLKGVGIWNCMIWSPHVWTVINAQFDIDKILSR